MLLPQLPFHSNHLLTLLSPAPAPHHPPLSSPSAPPLPDNISALPPPTFPPHPFPLPPFPPPPFRRSCSPLWGGS
ncbi:unnamed protein product [Closterium sp. NIES-54]